MTYITLGLSQKKHLPVLYYFTYTYPLWHLPRLLRFERTFAIKKGGKGNAAYENFEVIHRPSGQRLLLSYRYMMLIVGEWEAWKYSYLPPSGIKGKVVLDVGAGEGETVLFFLLNGAAKVVCVEKSQDCVAILKANAARNSWPVKIINESFRPEHLDMPHDFAKIDCEGGERVLLERKDYAIPFAVEIHPRYLTQEEIEELVQAFGLKRVVKDTWVRIK